MQNLVPHHHHHHPHPPTPTSRPPKGSASAWPLARPGRQIGFLTLPCACGGSSGGGGGALRPFPAPGPRWESGGYAHPHPRRRGWHRGPRPAEWAGKVRKPDRARRVAGATVSPCPAKSKSAPSVFKSGWRFSESCLLGRDGRGGGGGTPWNPGGSIGFRPEWADR